MNPGGCRYVPECFCSLSSIGFNVNGGVVVYDGVGIGCEGPWLFTVFPPYVLNGAMVTGFSDA